MTGNIVARRYAKALFAVGKQQGESELAAYGKELSEMAGVLEESPEALSFFRNPVFSTDEKKNVLEKLSEKLSVNKVVKNFCDLLADKDRLAVLPEINMDYRSMLDAEQGIVRGILVTAYELSEDRQNQLKEQLEKQAGQKLELTFSADKDILGGLVLKIGDKVLDASLRAQLQILKETIKRGE